MPGIVEIIILAAVQGLTEFLPVSSSGHLVLVQHLLGSSEGNVFFDVVLHVGTLGSVVVVYRRELIRLLRFDRPAALYILSLAVGTLPAAVVGFLAKDFIDNLFAAPRFAAAGLLLTAAVLASTRLSRREAGPLPEPWEPGAVPPLKAFFVGMAQAIAIAPGISRSGSTIAASLWLGLPRAEAARFSFLLSIPAIAGALVLHLAKGEVITSGEWAPLLAGAGVAFLVGLLAIRWTALAVVQSHFWRFGIYCLLVGIGALVWLN